MLRVAVVGSGPAGVYAAETLVAHGGVRVDVIDRLPCPYGLVRYGVAPDHEKMKSVAATMQKTFEHEDVRFLGNVEVGSDLELDDLRRYYDAVVFATGAAIDRHMGVPGEELGGSFSATEFVAWYSGHPDADIDRFTLESKSVCVVGVGNVAIDVARVLAKSVDELAQTDMPDHVLDVLRRSHVEDIHVIGRRGPAQAKFTTKELRELGMLDSVDVLVHPEELVLDDASKEAVAREPAARRNVDVLREWSERRPQGRPRRIHLRFLLRPAAIVGTQQVQAMRLERARLDGRGGATGTGEYVDVEAQMVLRSVGYRGTPLPGLPFDAGVGVIPNEAGRVIRDGRPVPGEYVTGWIKRGPTGVIGTNKPDAKETVASLLEDVESLPRASERDPDAVVRALEDRGVFVVDWTGWQAIDRAELEIGRLQGRRRGKIARRSELLAAADGTRRVDARTTA